MRQLIKPQPAGNVPRVIRCEYYEPIVIRRGQQEPGPLVYGFWSEDEGWQSTYKPGDICYLREPLHTRALDEEDGFDLVGDVPFYSDTDELCEIEWTWDRFHLTSSQFPKSAARTFVRITDVRVEKICDISEQDAIAEGCSHTEFVSADEIETAREQFLRLWQDGSLDSWVWVYEWEMT